LIEFDVVIIGGGLSGSSTALNLSKKGYSVLVIEKEKVVAETLNGRFAMLGLIAAVGAYLTTGQIIPGFV